MFSCRFACVALILVAPAFGKSIPSTAVALPLVFEPNAGQTSRDVKFLSRRSGMNVFFTARSASFVFNNSSVSLSFNGANPYPIIEGDTQLPGNSNYLIGKDPLRWKTGIAHFARVRYRDLYPGIDAIFYGDNNLLEYDLVVHPGADLSRVAFRLDGVRQLRHRHGDLVIAIGEGEMRCRKPLVYQEIAGKRHVIDAEYVIAGNLVHFRIARYDRAQPLIIDPVFDYGTYLGGSGSEWGYAVAVDKSGNAFITGHTTSTNFPVNTTLQPNFGGGLGDVFITKILPDSSGILYSTYIGGDSSEGDSLGYVGGIAVDSAGNAYVTGVTHSAGFPVTESSFQPAFGTRDTCGSGPAAGPCGDAFVLKLNASGNALIYSSFLGGGNHDEAKALALDSTGAAYITGITTSADFPTTINAFQHVPQYQDAFVSKISSDGSTLDYSTLLGGSGYDLALAIAVDSAGRAHVTGMTESVDFPLKNPLSAELGKPWDVFVTTFNQDGSAIEFSTLLGGAGTQQAMGIALDLSGNIYLCGYTDSANFPIVNAFQPDFGGGGGNGFVTKLSADGSSILYSTFLGGYDAVSELDAITVDSQGAAYVAGSGGSDYPIVNNVRAYSGGADLVFTKLSPDGSAVYFSSFFGGNGYDLASGIVLDSQNNILLTGQTGSSNLPSAWGPQRFLSGSTDAFLLRFTQPFVDKPIFSAPRNIPLGSTYVGQFSPPKVIRISNPGNRTLNVSKMTPSSNVVATSDCSALSQGSSCTISVSLKLNSASPGTGTLTVYDDAADTPQIFTVRGTGVYGGDVEVVSLTAGALSGMNGSLTQPFTAIIRNNGPYDAEGIALHISNNIGGNECNPCTIGTLKSGELSTASFNRVPSTFGNLTVTGNVTTASRTPDVNSSNDAKSITVTIPLYQPDATQVAFSAEAVNVPSAPQRIRFHDLGGGPFHLTLSVSGDFSLTSNCGTPNDSNCWADIYFTPSAAGNRAGSLIIQESVAGTSHSVPLSGVGILAPYPLFSPNALDLGTRMIGRTSQAMQISLKNIGSAPLQIASITTAGDFAQSNACPATLDTGAACNLLITFTPLGTGMRSGSLLLQDNAPGSPHSLPLTGQGVTASITLAPSTLDFGVQRVGTSSLAQSITYTNISGVTLRVTSISTPAGFQQTNDCATLAPDAGCHINVKFAPSAMGLFGGTLTIRDDGIGSPRAVALTGTGIEPIVTLDRASLDFGALRIGAASPTQFVALTNTGNSSLAISSVVATGDFAVTSGCTTALSVGASCYLVVVFRPTAVGPRTGELLITDSASGSPHRVSLSGTGKPLQVNWSPESLVFGAQAIGTTSASQPVIIKNDSGAPVTMASIATSLEFSQTNTCGALLPADSTCSINVVFSPSLIGLRSGTLTISDSTGSHHISLSGTGAAAAISLSPVKLDYGQLLVNASLAQTLNVVSTGNAPLNINSISIAGFAFDFVSTCPAQLATGKSCEIKVRFAPAVAEAATGSLIIKDDAPGSPHLVPLTGMGIQMIVPIERPGRQPHGTTAVTSPNPSPAPASDLPLQISIPVVVTLDTPISTTTPAETHTQKDEPALEKKRCPKQLRAPQRLRKFNELDSNLDDCEGRQE